jgi:serine/threonine-protein kinase HipA
MTELLRLDVWLDGAAIPAGRLTSYDDGALIFYYFVDYLEAGGRAISMSLPRQMAPHGDVVSRAFFGNLLPENNQTRRIREREGLEANDIAGILLHMGADCPGAISVLPEGSPPIKVPGNLADDYMPLSEIQIAEIMVSLADYERLPDDARDPSPLAGVQSKVAITILPNGVWALPRPELKVPTTHILKVPSRTDAADVPLEAAACQLSRTIGLTTSVPDVIRIADRDGLLITRFDRHVVDGVVYRIHQEDFTQALGLPAQLKYERKGVEGRRFDAEAINSVLAQTSLPAASRETFLIATIFNLVVGNSDNHGKNHGLLYSVGPVPNFAPLYDIVPVRMRTRYTHDLAFRVGEATTAEAVTLQDMLSFMGVLGMTSSGAKRFVNNSVGPLLERIEQAAAGLPRHLKPFDDFIGQELERLAEALELNLKFRTRDYYVPQGGGWKPQS